jgi:hypothetical protein
LDDRYRDGLIASLDDPSYIGGRVNNSFPDWYDLFGLDDDFGVLGLGSGRDGIDEISRTRLEWVPAGSLFLSLLLCSNEIMFQVLGEPGSGYPFWCDCSKVRAGPIEVTGQRGADR